MNIELEICIVKTIFFILSLYFGFWNKIVGIYILCSKNTPILVLTSTPQKQSFKVFFWSLNTDFVQSLSPSYVLVCALCTINYTETFIWFCKIEMVIRHMIHVSFSIKCFYDLANRKTNWYQLKSLIFRSEIILYYNAVSV